MKIVRTTHLFQTCAVLLLVFALAFAPVLRMVPLVAAEETDTTAPSAPETVEEPTDETDPEESTEEIVEEEESEDEEEEDGLPLSDIEDIHATGTVEVETGDAVAVGDLDTVVNTNETEVTPASTTASTTVDAETASTTPSVFGFSDETEVNATNSNEAEIGNTATVTADTGNNGAVGGSAAVTTGNAYAVANVVNLANTNIINSNGFIEFFSSLGFSTIDLRDIFGVFDNAQSTTPCIAATCGSDVTYNVTNDNNATITNNVSVTADTGGNGAYGSDNATITTGNAYAAANVLNIANTNITDSNYLVLSFSNLGDFDNDILLPNGGVLSQLFGTGGGAGVSSVQNNNSATINNDLSVDANTGGNESAGGGDITTGAAAGSGAISNVINQNFFGTDQFLLVIRVHGDWSGGVYGLPAGMSWAETPDGIQIYSGGDSAGIGAGEYAVNNNNSALINNNVSVLALTGDNKALGEDGEIATGNAYASGNITNIVNTNVIGQNWALLIFDILGDWNGSLSFGQPDLWVGVTAKSPDNPVMPGSDVEYTFTVTNLGDSPARNVTLENAFPKKLLSSSGATAIDNFMNGQAHELGTLAPGETKEMKLSGVVNSNLLANKEISIDMYAKVSTTDGEGNLSNNQDMVTVVSGYEKDDDKKPGLSFPGRVEIEKVASVNEVTTPATIDYTVTITNKGGPIYHGALKDILRDEEGNVVLENSWELGEIKNDDVVTVEYSVEYVSGMNSGTYTNTAQLAGFHRSENLRYRQLYLSEEATAAVEITGLEGEVLGLSTDSCPPYLEEYLKFGNDNDSSQVERLQAFLQGFEGMSVDVTGIFDQTTDTAVKAFQLKYQDEVLTPWGMSAASGYVYYTTQKKINELACNDATVFPLTLTQQTEIERFRFASDVPLQPEVPSDTFGLENVPAHNAIREAAEHVVELPSADVPPQNDQALRTNTGTVKSSLVDWVSRHMVSLWDTVSLR